VHNRPMASQTTFKANLLLLTVASIWGLSFVAQKAGMEHVGPLTFNGARALLGTLTLVPLLLLRRTRARIEPRKLAVQGLFLGWVLFGGSALMQVGIQYTTAGKAGFITGLYVVLVPVFGMMLGRAASRNVWFGVVCAIAGLYLLSVSDGIRPGRGDLLVLGGAVFWAMHMLLIDRFVRETDTVILSFAQFAVCTVLSWLAALMFETIRWQEIREAWITITYAGVMTIGVALTLQAYAQREAHPSHAAIILCLEGAIAALAGWLILGEILSQRMLAGCALIVAGMLASQWSTIRQIKRKRERNS